MSNSKSDTTLSKNSIAEEQRRTAAYALNLCTVSVSQIIDYEDLNVLEQEYEAILNNLNLENMPKDDALLNILRQLLDTITYFRIEKGEKEMIEKQYQQKMKNAIWNAVPNFGMIVATGNPIAMAVSLASQVGIGYMNYRRNKAENSLEYEQQLWQLQRTAIEQFNGLRRELFDTAWRLADAYDFPDEYRLTERQITQYNKILMDTDDIRKYERLESIQDKFEAYPPFWYFIGNSAARIAGDKDSYEDETRAVYRKKALEYFDKYEELNKFNLLREDSIAAACVLEHVDLLLLEEKRDNNKINSLLRNAVKNAGNSNDILQLCAFAYLKTQNHEEAEKLFRILVNEDYNRVVNAQLLSSIYVKSNKYAEYDLLTKRVSVDYLFPKPDDESEEAKNKANEVFLQNRKNLFFRKFNACLKNYYTKYAARFNKLTSTFDNSSQYPEDFFFDEACDKRISHAQRVFSSANKVNEYRLNISSSEYTLGLLDILNEMYEGIIKSKLFANEALHQQIKDDIKRKIEESKSKVNDVEQKIQNGKFDFNAYKLAQEITLWSFTESAFKALFTHMLNNIHNATISDDVDGIADYEDNLAKFCYDNELKDPDDVEIYSDIILQSAQNNSLKNAFTPLLFGEDAVGNYNKANIMKQMIDFAKTKEMEIRQNRSDDEIYFREPDNFGLYFYNKKLEKKNVSALLNTLNTHAVMVVVSRTNKFDLIFTTFGVAFIYKNEYRRTIPYYSTDLRCRQEFAGLTTLIDGFSALTSDINNNNCNQITTVSVPTYNLIAQNDIQKNVEQTYFCDDNSEPIKYIDTLTKQLLERWFRVQKGSNDKYAYCACGPATKERLAYFGYVGEKLDETKHMVQWYNNPTIKVNKYRIISYNRLDKHLADELARIGGYIKVSS